MNSKIVCMVVLIILFSFIGYAQSNADSLSLNFKVNFEKQSLQLNQQYISSNKDTLTLESFKCYIAAIRIQYDDKTVYSQKNSYHLLDLENLNSLQIPICKNTDKIISKITFNIGIDSLTNTSGALNGDLDPINGMYWAWQSGYINFKIEGKSPSCKTRKNEFHFHIGGYLPPFNTMRKIELIYDKKANQINIGMDLNNFFSNIHLAETNSVMIPGNQANDLADYGTKLFYIE